MALFKHILGIETSCDDTSVSILTGDGVVLAQKSVNQDMLHKPFGGIVPEIASRNHTVFLLPMIDELLKSQNLKLSDINAIAATNRPGLLGSLLVGMVTAKTLSLSLNIPWIGVHHIEGHIMAPFLKDAEYEAPKNWSFPFLSLVVSGGHTSLYEVNAPCEYKLLGATIDDAAGEAFDKFAKMMGLGYPGGAQVDQFSKNGDTKKYSFPRALIHEENFNFSFSGLKTAAQRVLSGMSEAELTNNKSDLCASYQEAIVDVLVQKVDRAAQELSINKISLTGGVSANSRLREAFEDLCKKKNYILAVPPLRYCTDNASMIAMAGLQRLNRGERSSLKEGVHARAAI